MLPQLIGGASAVPQFGGQNGGGNGAFPQGGNGGNFPGAPQATVEATSEATSEAGEPTAVALALTAQTGLASADLLTQIQAGSTIADLVAANNGDLNAAITAIAGALDGMVAAGGREAQMIARFGSDTTQVATQLVNGELGQAQQFLLPQLISGQSAVPQLNGKLRPTAVRLWTRPPNADANDPDNPHATIPRPTRIVFPTAAPTLAASATPMLKPPAKPAAATRWARPDLRHHRRLQPERPQPADDRRQHRVDLDPLRHNRQRRRPQQRGLVSRRLCRANRLGQRRIRHRQRCLRQPANVALSSQVESGAEVQLCP